MASFDTVIDTTLAPASVGGSFDTVTDTTLASATDGPVRLVRNAGDTAWSLVKVQIRNTADTAWIWG